ncbi:hypothetical protein FJT64_006419 [Amphibalanus amphitrite]|uniref:G-protein coupled receptors family 1 profile domain-containing protein n=1 Tax=Amphibalanus amphitrite TaxID=1232801 RepID=A0A6A4W286_AMPAM|nr:hypothetical protein FJT64_006419 [Amphibalanus amphitrite]
MSVGNGRNGSPDGALPAGGGPTELLPGPVDLLSDDLPPGLVPNLSSECLLKIAEFLECHERRGAADHSELVCTPHSGQEGGISTRSAHAIFVTVIAVTVALTVVLNSAVIVTIAVNRRLHTLVNYLVSLLCANQLAWIVFPIAESSLNVHLYDSLCLLRYIVMQSTTSMNFGLIVTITLLRYLIVVRNHSYPGGKQNMLVFTVLAGLPCTFRWLLFRADDNGRCGTLFASTPDGYDINQPAERHEPLRTFIIILIEYIIGLTIVGFCYYKILAKALASRRRLRRHSNRSQGHPCLSVRAPIAVTWRRATGRVTIETGGGQGAAAASPATAGAGHSARPTKEVVLAPKDLELASASSPVPPAANSSLTRPRSPAAIPSVMTTALTPATVSMVSLGTSATSGSGPSRAPTSAATPESMADTTQRRRTILPAEQRPPVRQTGRIDVVATSWFSRHFSANVHKF